MVDQFSEDAYDVDLTVDTDEQETYQDIDPVDLFENVGGEGSPISQLKSLVLSIDWEITDEILEQFMEELQTLKELWVEDKVKQVYVQGLHKIANYIYKEKANANPNAIKLLLTFYHDLEKIVTTESMDYEEKKRILLEDVNKFEYLKRQIFKETKKDETAEAALSEPAPTIPEPPLETAVRSEEPVEVIEENLDEEIEGFEEDIEEDIKEEIKEEVEEEVEEEIEEEIEEDSALDQIAVASGDGYILRGLKAAVLGIDWEITDHDLDLLASEVFRLEEIYERSKAKLIFLQGIGALGAYINLKRSNAHAGAFNLLRSFFDGMEKVIVEGLTGEEEKEILLTEVDKFNEFKEIIAATIPRSADRIKDEQAFVSQTDEIDIDDDNEPAPALSDESLDSPPEQVDEDGQGVGSEVESEVSSFFADKEEGSDTDTAFTPQDEEIQDDQKNQVIDEIDSRLQGFFDSEPDEDQDEHIDSEKALQGVDVESPADDDSGEAPLLMKDDDLAPALSSVDEDQSESEGIAEQPEVDTAQDEDTIAEQPEVDTAQDEDTALDEDTTQDEDTDQDEVSELTQVMLVEGEESDDLINAIQGVDVETEADDDSDEEPLPLLDGELAPALLDHEGETGFKESDFIADHEDQATDDHIKNRLDQFFFEEQAVSSSGEEAFAGALEEAERIDQEAESDDIVEKFDSFFTAEEDEDDIPIMMQDETHLIPDDDDVEAFAISDDDEIETLTIPDEDEVESLTAPDTDEVETYSESDEDSVETLLIPDEDEDTVDLFAQDSTTFFGDEGDEIYKELFTEEVSADLFIEEVSDEPSVVEEEDEGELLFAEDEPISDEVSSESPIGVSEEAEELLKSVGEEEDLFAPADIEEEQTDLGLDDAFSIADEEEDIVFQPVDDDWPYEEEVVFRAVVEDDDSPGISSDDFDLGGVTASDEDKGDDFLFFDNIDEEQETAQDIDFSVPGQKVASAVSDSQPEGDDSIEFDLITDKESGEETFTAPVDRQVRTEKSRKLFKAPSLTTLQECITSIGIEAEESVFKQLVTEINRLTLEFKDRPIEKTFLYLISTIVQQIKQNRRGNWSGAYTLLQSVFDRFDYTVRSPLTVEQAQEVLLTETSKVLLWQQTRLDVRSGNEETTETFGVFDDSTYEDQGNSNNLFFDDEPLVEEIQEEESDGNDILSDSDEPPVSSKIEKELNALKDDLESELESLRADLQQKPK